MRRIISYKVSVGETALLILDELASAAIKSFYPHPYYHTFCAHAHRRSLYHALRRMERRYLIGVKRRGRGDEWYLTDEGKRLAKRLKAKIQHAKQQKRWDGRWRVVIFDVPERIRGRRDFLRKELSSLGFHQLQKSVWVTPYPLPQEFMAFTGELELGKHFRVLTVERVENDSDLRALFFPSISIVPV